MMIRPRREAIRDWGSTMRAATSVVLMLAVWTPVAVMAQGMAPPPARRGSGAPGPNSPARPTPGSGSGSSQSKPASSPPNPGEVSVPPIECWWKTDRSAVSVGERFQLTLTCAVLATERVSVVVDESSLEPSALHLTPFEIVGGQRFRDILNAPRKFFQYQYTMRVLGEEFFGKEVPLPRLQITYRVQNSLQGGAALQGREAQYSLVPVPIRVLSLVPPGAPDIRDTSLDTFGDVERRLFRSNLFFIVASVAFVLAGLMLVMLLARAASKRRAASATRHRQVSSMAVLQAALRELGAVRSASQKDGWTGELAGRAAAAMRLAGAVALSRPVSQKEVDRRTAVTEGEIAALPSLNTLRGKTTMLSAAVTPESVVVNGNARGSELWRSLSQSLGAFTAARYARPSAASGGSRAGRADASHGRNGGIDGTALDAALAEGEDAIKRLRVRQVLRFGRRAHHVETTGTRQTWER